MAQILRMSSINSIIPTLDDNRSYQAVRQSLQVQQLFRQIAEAQTMDMAKDSIVALMHCSYVADLITCDELEGLLRLYGQRIYDREVAP